MRYICAAIGHQVLRRHFDDPSASHAGQDAFWTVNGFNIPCTPRILAASASEISEILIPHHGLPASFRGLLSIPPGRFTNEVRRWFWPKSASMAAFLVCPNFRNVRFTNPVLTFVLTLVLRLGQVEGCFKSGVIALWCWFRHKKIYFPQGFYENNWCWL